MLAIYTRLSKEDEENKSIKHQKREGISFANTHNLEFRIYDEGEGVSGTLDIDKRPQLKKLTENIIDGSISMVWFRNQNRLERNSVTYHTFINYARKYNVKLFFGDREYDLSDPTQLLQNSIISSINQYKTDLQSFQTKRTLLDNIKEGKANGRILPYGYKSNEDGYLVIDEEEAEIVKKIFTMSLEGKGQKTIANWLNKNNIPTRYNKLEGTLTTKNKYSKEKRTVNKSKIKWSNKVPHDIIKNPIYKGERRWKGKTYPAPPIVTKEYWKKVNDNLKNNRNNSGKKVEHKYLLKGLLRCAKCGKNYYGRSRTSDPKGYRIRESKDGKIRKDYNLYTCASKRYKYTNCGSRDIKLVELDALIWGVFFEEQLLIEKMKLFLSNTDLIKREEEVKHRISNLELDVQILENKKLRAVKIILEHEDLEEDFKAQINSLKSQIANTKERLAFEKGVLESIKNVESIFKDKIESLNSLKKELPFLDKKNVIHEFIKEIVLYTSLPNDPKGSFIQVNIYYKDMNLEEDKFLFNLNQGIAVNLFNQKVISLYHSINRKQFLESLAPIFSEVQTHNKNVQK